MGGDAAAHPVFCLTNLFLPCHVYALLAHTPLAALMPLTTIRLQAGVHLHSRPGFAVMMRERRSWTNLKRSFVVANYSTKGFCRVYGKIKKCQWTVLFCVENRKTM